MGWNTNVVIARDRTIKDVVGQVPDVYTATDRAIDFELAASTRLAPNLAIAEISTTNLWGAKTDVVLFDPLGRLADNYDTWLDRLSRIHPAVVLSLDAVRGRHGVTLFDFGRERCRLRWRGRELIEAVGAHPALRPDQLPMPDWGCDETFLFALAVAAGGPSLADVCAARYRRIDFG